MPVPGYTYFNTSFAIDGDKVNVPDALDVTGLVSYEQGYTSDYSLPDSDPSYKPIERDKWNDIIYQVTLAVQEIQQQGSAVFITDLANGGAPFGYGRGARTFLNGTNYQSLVDNNTDTPPSANWSDLDKITIQFGAEPVAPTGLFNMDGINTFAKSSGAVNNGTQFEKLYTYLYNNYTDAAAPVNGGRGANAAADFAANKYITIPDRTGFTPIGVKAATPITSASATFGATTVAAAGSNSSGTSGNTTLDTSQIPSHTHAITPFIQSVISNSSTGIVWMGTSGTINTQATGGGGGHTHTTPAPTFTGSATSVMQPSAGIYWYINY